MKTRATITVSLTLLLALAVGVQYLFAAEENTGSSYRYNDTESTLDDLLQVAGKSFSEISIVLNLTDEKELDEPLSAFNITLDDLSLVLSVPTGKIIEALELDEDVDRSKLIIDDLGLGLQEIKEAYDRFKEQRWHYSWNIVLVGMIVIFSSLALTGFFVGQLSSIGREKKPGKKTKQHPDTQNDAKQKKDSVIAAIATVHLHLKEAEESERLIIAWNREPVCVWKTSGKMVMPNQARENLRQSQPK